MAALDPSDPATIEWTGTTTPTPRLDRLAALDDLIHDAEAGTTTVDEGVRRLDELAAAPDRFNAILRVVGYAVLTAGIALILHPAPDDVAAAAVLGALVGTLLLLTRDLAAVQVLLPIIAAFATLGTGRASPWTSG